MAAVFTLDAIIKSYEGRTVLDMTEVSEWDTVSGIFKPYGITVKRYCDNYMIELLKRNIRVKLSRIVF